MPKQSRIEVKVTTMIKACQTHDVTGKQTDVKVTYYFIKGCKNVNDL
jgi:hypothetical protein